MRRLSTGVCVGALIVAATAIDAGPALAAKGGNGDTAKLCQHGAWRTLVSASGARFANQGDCVNDGAKGLDVRPGIDPQAACEGLSGGVFTNGGTGEFTIWTCRFNTPPESSVFQPQLETVCDGEDGTFVLTGPTAGTTEGQCNQSG